MSKLSTTENNQIRGQRLLAVREAAKLTQAEFAERLGLSTRAYLNYEHGERETPATLQQSLYEEFNIDPLWLLAGPGSEPVYARNRDIDVELTTRIVLLVEQHLANRRAKLSLQKKIRLTQLIYAHCTDGEVNESFLKEMVALTK